MPREPSAAEALYGHLPSAAREPVKPRANSVGDAMWPSLSREAKQRQAQEAYWRAEQKARTARTVQRLDVIIEQLRAEKRGR